MARLPLLVGHIDQVLLPPRLDELDAGVLVPADHRTLTLGDVVEVGLEGVCEAVVSAPHIQPLETLRLVEGLDRVLGGHADLGEEERRLIPPQVLLRTHCGLCHQGVGLACEGVDAWKGHTVGGAKLLELRGVGELGLVEADVDKRGHGVRGTL